MDYTIFLPDNLDLYVFDLDGTLVDSLEDIALSVNWILAESGFPEVDAETVRKNVGCGARNLIVRTFEASARKAGTAPLSGEALSEALARYRDHYAANCTAHTRLYPGMREWLESLDGRGKKLAVLTNKPVSATTRILASLGVSGLFDVLAGPETFGTLKPEPAGLLRLMEKFGVPAERTVMVGDSFVDVQTGKNAGAHTCGITGGLGDEAALREARPDIVIERRT